MQTHHEQQPGPVRPRLRGECRPELSPREREIYLLIAQGWKIKAIARRLGNDRRTVSEFRRRLLLKLSLENDAQIAVHAYVRGLTTWPFNTRDVPQ